MDDPGISQFEHRIRNAVQLKERAANSRRVEMKIERLHDRQESNAIGGAHERLDLLKETRMTFRQIERPRRPAIHA